MPLLDDRGRVFGRLNLVDAAVGLLLLALLPAAFGSYLLFREPAPKLMAVVPSVVSQAPNLQVEVRGENFRPYMRVSVNDIQGRTFLFYNPKSAFVQFVDLPPGTYDVVLYDYMQEVARLRGALTVQAPPGPETIQVDVNGFLTGLTADQARLLQRGHRFPESGELAGELLEVGAPEPEVLHIKTGDNPVLFVPGTGLQLPARVRVRCRVETAADATLRCAVGAVALAPDANVRLPGLNTALNLRVSDVHYPGRSETVAVHVRFLVSPDVFSRIHRMDQDLGARAHPSGEMATLVSFADQGDGSAAFLRDEHVRQAVPTGRLLLVEGELSVPAQETPLGWLYKDTLLKVGSPFTFETAAYTMDGGVIDVTAPPREP